MILNPLELSVIISLFRSSTLLHLQNPFCPVSNIFAVSRDLMCRHLLNKQGDMKKTLSEQCKEIEENNKMGKTRDISKKIRDTKGNFMPRLAQ